MTVRESSRIKKNPEQAEWKESSIAVFLNPLLTSGFVGYSLPSALCNGAHSADRVIHGDRVQHNETCLLVSYRIFLINFVVVI